MIHLALLNNNRANHPSRLERREMLVEDQESVEQLTSIEQLLLRIGWLEQRRFAHDLSNFGLTVPQFFVLRSISLRGQQRTMSALAGDTLHRCATMTGIVDRLVKMGLVARHRDTSDRRRVLVELTPAGREVLDKVRRSREKRLHETLARLSPEDAKELLRLLRVYLEAFRIQYTDTDKSVPDVEDASSAAWR